MSKFCLNKNEELHNFTVTKTETLPEIEYLGSSGKTANAYELKHASGARLLYLENDDPEMSFTIGFKTLPKDSTGVFHILEHSVLCGSRKFPVKEPFTNLLKSSMQTFLNAMTFPDKTIYPVASTNEKDLYNLIDVYMDAVLFPNIYKNKNIFLQEGGHKTEDGFSGVVYNEMKGVYSDPEEHIFEGLMKQLFPGSCYSYSSGGDPKYIEQLSYEQYLEQHNSNYKLDNSYIIVYGKLSISKMLEYLDSNYLSQANELKKWREGVKTTPQGSLEDNFKQSKTLKVEVATSKDNAECGAGFVFGRDHRKILATRILVDALCSSNESPLKKALLQQNFAKEIDFEILAEIYEPFIICECKGIKAGEGEKIISRIQKAVDGITSKGINKDLLRATISNKEFKLKEKIPAYTSGLDASIAVFEEWLYDEDASTDVLKYLEDIEWLKAQIDTNFFEDLAKEVFLNNKKTASVEVVPCENAEAKKFDRSNDELASIKQEINDLEKWQSTPDKKEDEAKLPVMEISDIGEIEEYPIWKESGKPVQNLEYEIATNGISHVNRYYPLNNIAVEDYKYAGILCTLLGKLDTQKYTSEEIDILGQEKLGHLNFSLNFYENLKDVNDIAPKLCVRSSALDQNSNYLASLVDEICQNTKFEDKDKIKTILFQRKVMMEQAFINAGHSAAAGKALSELLPVAKLLEMTAGVDFYFDLKKLINEDMAQLCDKLVEVSSKIFSTKPIITFAGKNILNKIDIKDEELCELPNFAKLINKDKHNYAVKIPSQVNYCTMVNDVRLSNSKMSGSKICASKILSLDYLWNNVRVKNGAYGGGFTINAKGTSQFYSYRDPKLNETYQNFVNSTKWLSDLDLSQRDLDNYIISTVAKIDAPASVRSKMIVQDNLFFTKTPTDARKKCRDEIIKTGIEDIKKSGAEFREMNKSSVKCVFGGNIQDIDNKDKYKFIDLFNN